MTSLLIFTFCIWVQLRNVPLIFSTFLYHFLVFLLLFACLIFIFTHTHTHTHTHTTSSKLRNTERQTQRPMCPPTWREVLGKLGLVIWHLMCFQCFQMNWSLLNEWKWTKVNVCLSVCVQLNVWNPIQIIEYTNE